jgi:hypothetical protein
MILVVMLILSPTFEGDRVTRKFQGKEPAMRYFVLLIHIFAKMEGLHRSDVIDDKCSQRFHSKSAGMNPEAKFDHWAIDRKAIVPKMLPGVFMNVF